MATSSPGQHTGCVGCATSFRAQEFETETKIGENQQLRSSRDRPHLFLTALVVPGMSHLIYSWQDSNASFEDRTDGGNYMNDSALQLLAET